MNYHSMVPNHYKSNDINMIHVLKNKQEWDQLIASFPNADFYHTYDYHQLSKKENETPVLIKYEEDARIIALPILVRKIDNSGFRDATSVYGYCGPLSINIHDGFDNSKFRQQLTLWCKQHKIVSVFTRLNPFVKQQGTILEGIGHITTMGNVVNINLANNLDSQKQDYQKRLITYINTSRRECTFRKAKSKEDILRFIELYYETMWRVGADKTYYFPKHYFFGLLASSSFKAEILFAIDISTKDIMGGALFVMKNDTVQYHLSGTNEKFLKRSPLKVLIDEMRVRVAQEGYIHFNLGGGVGNSKDSLFYFKSGFSKDYRPFKLWKFIVDPSAYNTLVHSRFKDYEEIVEQCCEFFPLYRCRILEDSLNVKNF